MQMRKTNCEKGYFGLKLPNSPKLPNMLDFIVGNTNE